MITHRKTRTGCVQCKARRIKCDETKPQCEKCRRTNRECSFQVATPATTQRAAGPSQDVFTTKEMELLHHFIMHTSMAVVENAALQRVWQTGVVDLALKHKFLMHTVLALSALHLAYRRPEESTDLCLLAANHQDQGLAGFRSELAKFDEENCHALLASSILVIFYVPGSSGTRINANKVSASMINEVLFNAIIDWLQLIRGYHHIVARGRPWLERGPISKLVPREAWYRTNEPADERARSEDVYLASLERLWAPDTPATVAGRDEGDIEVFNNALMDLRHAFARMSVAVARNQGCCWCSDDNETEAEMDQRMPFIIAGFLWTMLIPEKLFQLFEAQRPEVLILFAHNTVLIKRVSGEWWNRSPALKIITGISAALPAEYQSWIEWPQREIGYNPHAAVESSSLVVPP